MYVSLEPCCHTGRTPPCTDAIIEAGIARVVIASDDPTDKAAGRGPGILRDEGIEVVIADGEPAGGARRLNQPFRKHARTGRPWVLFKSAMTLDGKVATRTGDSKWISGEDSRRLSHHWRAEVDAVASGSAPRWPTTRSSPRASTASSASRAGSSSTPRRACRSIRNWSAAPWRCR